MHVADGEERQKPRRIGSRSRFGWRQELPAFVFAGTPLPRAVAIDRILGDVIRENLHRVRRDGDGPDRALACPQRGSASEKRQPRQNRHTDDWDNLKSHNVHKC